MSTTRRALAFSYLDRYASLVVFIVTSMIIARLLTPAQMGIFSITMVMIGFVAPFRDLGARLPRCSTPTTSWKRQLTTSLAQSAAPN